jgi:hypothetical protein
MGRPSLNWDGSRTSQRGKALISRWTFDTEGNPFDGEKGEGILRHHHFARGPALEGKSSGQKAQGTALCFVIWKPDDNHGASLDQTGTVDKAGEREQNLF